MNTEELPPISISPVRPPGQEKYPEESWDERDDRLRHELERSRQKEKDEKEKPNDSLKLPPKEGITDSA